MSSSSSEQSSTILGPHLQRTSSSLLVHPFGMELVKKYKEQWEEMDDRRTIIVDQLVQALHDNHHAKKKNKKDDVVELSKAVRNVLQQSNHHQVTSSSTTTTTTTRKVTLMECECEQTGDSTQRHPTPCVVVRMKQQQEGEDKAINKMPVTMIIEVTVDEKRRGQAHDYVSLIQGSSSNGILLVTLHFGRNSESTLTIDIEAYVYKHDEVKVNRKHGFLWRESYEAETNSEADLASTVKKGCEGLVRCLNCSEYLSTELAVKSSAVQWKMVARNVAIETIGNKKYVYKAFDNRCRPTERKTEYWLLDENGEKWPWVKHLNVKSHFDYEESEGVLQHLGHPLQLHEAIYREAHKREGAHQNETGAQHQTKRQRVDTNVSDTGYITKATPYPWGSIRIMRYDYIQGSHFASKVSHFEDIANMIQGMHNKGIVHGDVRGFNMLHPEEGKEGGITKSCLIDFDLSGEASKARYPLGYNEAVLDNLNQRSGKAGCLLQEEDDWKDFISVMSLYEIDEDKLDNQPARKAWKAMEKGGPAGILKSLTDFGKTDFCGTPGGQLPICIFAPMKRKELEDLFSE